MNVEFLLPGMEFDIFKKYPQLKYGISKKRHGSLKKITTDFNSADIFRRNEKDFLTKEGIKDSKIYELKQVHGNKVLNSENITGNATFVADALVTNESNKVLTITVADCYPIYLFDPTRKIVAIAHAGWRGITKDILCNVIDYFVLKFSSDPQDILVGIGPGLGKCHFEVKEDVLDNFTAYPEEIEHKNGKIFVDLSAILEKKMLERGLKRENIEFSGLCTYCENGKFFSRRRDKNSDEVMMAYIGMTV